MAAEIAETHERPTVFVSYSHADRVWLERLKVHLKPLGEKIDLWDDTRIKPGRRWREEIRKALKKARAAILLMSADFLASDFITKEELPSLLDSAENEGTEILIVIVSPSRFTSNERLSRFQTVNAPDAPLIRLSKFKREEVFVATADLVEMSLRRDVETHLLKGSVALEWEGIVDLEDTELPIAAGRPVAGCRDYANLLDIHISRGRKTFTFGYAAVVATPLLGVALIAAAWLTSDVAQRPAVVALMAAVGLMSLAFTYFIMRKVAEVQADVETCEVIKRNFDGCERWDRHELRDNVLLVLNFLRRAR